MFPGIYRKYYCEKRKIQCPYVLIFMSHMCVWLRWCVDNRNRFIQYTYMYIYIYANLGKHCMLCCVCLRGWRSKREWKRCACVCECVCVSVWMVGMGSGELGPFSSFILVQAQVWLLIWCEMKPYLQFHSFVS